MKIKKYSRGPKKLISVEIRLIELSLFIINDLEFFKSENNFFLYNCLKFSNEIFVCSIWLTLNGQTIETGCLFGKQGSIDRCLLIN